MQNLSKEAGTQSEDDLQSVRSIPAVSAVVFLLVYASCTNRGWLKPACEQSNNCSDEIFFRLAVLVAITIALWTAAKHIWDSTPIFSSSWWDIGRKPNDPSWDDVLQLTVTNDPLTHVRTLNWSASLVKAFAAYVTIGCVTVEAVTLVADGPIIPRLLSAKSPDGNGLSANLTALLALLAAAVSIHFAYRQLQAKVRADSRQAWIDKLRSRISRFIALADHAHSPNQGRPKRKDPDEFTTRRIEMELLLNPSEKDHRMLMYLSLRLAFFALGEDEFKSVEDVINIRKDIGIEDELSDDWFPLFKPIPSRFEDPAAYRKDYSDLIGYTLRLAHVVLKREWEQVKATR